jgi:hypothetical protein
VVPPAPDPNVDLGEIRICNNKPYAQFLRSYPAAETCPSFVSALPLTPHPSPHSPPPQSHPCDDDPSPDNPVTEPQGIFFLLRVDVGSAIAPLSSKCRRKMISKGVLSKGKIYVHGWPKTRLAGSSRGFSIFFLRIFHTIRISAGLPVPIHAVASRLFIVHAISRSLSDSLRGSEWISGRPMIFYPPPPLFSLPTPQRARGKEMAPRYFPRGEVT